MQRADYVALCLAMRAKPPGRIALEAIALVFVLPLAILAATGGNLADVVIEATGKQMPLDLGADLTRVRGRLIVAGYHQDGPRTVNMQLWNWRGLDVINAHERDPQIYKSGMEEGVRLLAARELDLEPLITHRFPLSDIERAFQTAEERPEGFIKSLVLPDGGGTTA
jgi:threonine dehydrogenase-like Zn-dependent dehydrogenase